MKPFVFAATLCLFTNAAFAQPAAPGPDLKVFASPDEIQALIAKAKVDRKGDAPQTN